MQRRKLWVVIPVAVVVIGALSIAGFTYAGQNRSSSGEGRVPVTVQSVPVKVAAVTRGVVSASLDYSGEVRARSTVTIVPKVSGRVEKMNVDVGSRVLAGDVLAELEHSQLDLQVQQAQAALDGAQAKLTGLKEGGRQEMVAQATANLAVAKAKLAAMEDGPRDETVAQAEANLRMAQARLDALKKGPTPEQIATAETQVRIAQDQLYAVQTQADAVLGNRATALGLTVYTEDMKKAQAGTAYEQVQLAQAQLAALKAPPTQEALDQVQSAVDAASQQLELAKHPFTENDLAQVRAAVQAAEQSVALAQSPATANDLRAASAAVDQASAALDLAKLQASESKIVAPVAGVVTDRPLNEGSMAAPTTPIFTLASAEVELAANVEENRVGSLAVGQPVQITASAYPDSTFDGSVRSIAPSVDARSRTVAVKIEPRDPDGKLKPGMFAQLSITTQQKQSSLLVPRDAVVGSGGQAAVFVVNGDRAYKSSVKLGVTQDQMAEVLSGLADGQEVVVQGQSGLTDGQLVSVQGR